MQVTITNTTTYKITCLDHLDPVTVYTENHEPGKGKITIECYGKTWSCFWGAMSGDTVEAFFCRCNEAYLANKLSTVDSEIADLEALSEAIGLNVEDASAVIWDKSVIQAIRDYYGCEPFEAELPQKPNPDYEYLCRVIRAVQAGLNEPGHSGSIQDSLDKIEIRSLRRALNERELKTPRTESDTALAVALLELVAEQTEESGPLSAEEIRSAIPVMAQLVMARIGRAKTREDA